MKRLFIGAVSAALILTAFAGCSKVDKDKYVGESSSASSVADNADGQDNQQNAAVNDWSALEIGIDAKVLTPKFNYSELTDMGWSFDPAIYGLSDCTLTKDQYLSCDVYLDKEGCDSGVLAIGFTNINNESAPLSDCQIWSIKVDIRDKTNYPTIAIPGGISWNASQDDIKSMLGDPTEVKQDEAGCTELVYTKDTSNIHFCVYDEGGMQKFFVEKF